MYIEAYPGLAFHPTRPLLAASNNMSANVYDDPSNTPALNPKLGDSAGIDDDDLAFLRDATGLQDNEKLKEHVLAVQKKAYAASIIAV